MVERVPSGAHGQLQVGGASWSSAGRQYLIPWNSVLQMVIKANFMCIFDI